MKNKLPAQQRKQKPLNDSASSKSFFSSPLQLSTRHEKYEKPACRERKVGERKLFNKMFYELNYYSSFFEQTCPPSHFRWRVIYTAQFYALFLPPTQTRYVYFLTLFFQRNNEMDILAEFLLYSSVITMEHSNALLLWEEETERQTETGSCSSSPLDHLPASPSLLFCAPINLIIKRQQ